MEGKGTKWQEMKRRRPPGLHWDSGNKEGGPTRDGSWFSVFGKLSSVWMFMTREDDSVAAKAEGGCGHRHSERPQTEKWMVGQGVIFEN